jgi:predicted nucleic acid-binding protein
VRADHPRKYYFDTVTLSNFALAGRVDLLISRYGQKALVTREVLDEIIDGIVAGYAALSEIESAVASGELGLTEPLVLSERDTYRKLLRILAPGEASCISCAMNRGGVVVTDDKTARDCCTERGITFTGTIGILIACYRDGELTSAEADVIVQAMIDAGYHSPVHRISDLI